MSSAPVLATQSLWQTLATEQTPGNIEMYGAWAAPKAVLTYILRVIRQELREFRKFMESHYKQFFGPCLLRVLVSTGISCLTKLLAEVRARIASLARGKKRKADDTWHRGEKIVIASFGNECPKP